MLAVSYFKQYKALKDLLIYVNEHYYIHLKGQ